MSSGIFMTSEEAGAGSFVFGQTTKSHRYKMPLLSGEHGTKAGGNWVPGHMRSATNLAGAISESFALGRWDRQQGQIGMALRSDLFEMLVIAVNAVRFDPGMDAQRLSDSEGGKRLKATLDEIHAAAREVAGANRAAQEGTNRHTVWELRAATGQLTGTPLINRQIEELEALLKRCHLVRVSGLSERVIRNEELDCAGKFDDVLMDERTGKLYMADLKTKRRPFFSLLELWIQLYVYASAEWMLSHIGEDATYIPGPFHHVNQDTALILHMPVNSDEEGAQPMRIRKLDLTKGRRWALLARDVVAARSDGKSAESMAASYWSEDIDLAQWQPAGA